MMPLRQGLTAAPGDALPAASALPKSPCRVRGRVCGRKGYFWRGGVELHDREKPQLGVGWREPAHRPHHADDKVDVRFLDC
jgi:hypothetical protein